MKSLVTNQVLILAFFATSAPYYMLWQYFLREVNTDNTDVICLVCKAFLHSWSDLFHILTAAHEEGMVLVGISYSHCVSENSEAKDGDFVAQLIVLRPGAQHPYHPGAL